MDFMNKDECEMMFYVSTYGDCSQDKQTSFGLTSLKAETQGLVFNI